MDPQQALDALQKDPGGVNIDFSWATFVIVAFAAFYIWDRISSRRYRQRQENKRDRACDKVDENGETPEQKQIRLLEEISKKLSKLDTLEHLDTKLDRLEKQQEATTKANIETGEKIAALAGAFEAFLQLFSQGNLSSPMRSVASGKG